MTCYKRLKAFQPVSGGQIVFEPPSPTRKLLFKPIEVPCRQCTGCRIDHAAQWSLRLAHELQTQGNHGYFITLTYDDDHLPGDRSLDHHHVQLFIKYLRREFPDLKITYFVCGEYGSQTQRPHYHLIMFGFSLDDLKFYRSGKGVDGQKYKLYNSETLDRCWKRGHVVIGYANQQSINYTARYMLKELDFAEDYAVADAETGEYFAERKRPYIRMSTNPAPGRKWIEKYHGDCVKGYLTHSRGLKAKIPDYYIRKLEEINPELAERIKAEREKAVKELPQYSDSEMARIEKLKIREREFFKKRKPL